MNVRLKPLFDVVTTALVCAAALFVVWGQVEARWFKTSGPVAEDVKDLTLSADKIRYGKGESDLALVEFTDYECPFCGQHARESEDALNKFMVGDKPLRHVIVNFPLEQMHPRARPAAVLAECAGRQGKFWDVHHRLFADGNKLTDEELQKASEDAGLDQKALMECRSGNANAQIASDLAEGRRLGVTSTPTFFIGRAKADGSVVLEKRIRGAMPMAQMVGVIASVQQGTKGPGNLLSSLWKPE